MKFQEILKTCLRELKRCGISFLLIVIGVFLATKNAPAAPMPKRAPCMANMEIVNLVAARPLTPGNRTMVQPVGHSLHRFYTKQTSANCHANPPAGKAGKPYK